MDNESVIEALREGNKEGIMSVYNEVYDAVHSYVIRGGGTSSDVESVLWDGIERLHRKLLTDFYPTGSVRAYLFKICKNLWIDERQKRLRYGIQPDVTISQLADVVHDDAVSPDIALEAEKMKLLVLELSEMLPEDCKRSFREIYFGDKTYAQIAVDMGVSEAALRKRLYDCRARLREAILNSAHLPEFMGYFNFVK